MIVSFVYFTQWKSWGCASVNIGITSWLHNFLKVVYYRKVKRNAPQQAGKYSTSFFSPFFPFEIGRWTNGNDFLPRHLVPTGAWVHKGCPIFIVSRFLSWRPFTSQFLIQTITLFFPRVYNTCCISIVLQFIRYNEFSNFCVHNRNHLLIFRSNLKWI